MDDAKFIRDRIRQAREDAGLSQRKMATIMGVAQATISDIERGRVQISATELSRFARMLNKPITYFYPAPIRPQGDSETELLNILRGLPDEWQQRILTEARKQAIVYERVQPYIRAGVPEEFYGFLLWEQEEQLDLEKGASEDMPTDKELLEGEESHRSGHANIDAHIARLDFIAEFTGCGATVRKDTSHIAEQTLVDQSDGLLQGFGLDER